MFRKRPGLASLLREEVWLELVIEIEEQVFES